MSIIVDRHSADFANFTDMTIKFSHLGDYNIFRFSSPYEYTIGKPVRVLENNNIFFSGSIVHKSYDYENNIWKYEAYSDEYVYQDKVLTTKPYTWYNSYPEEIISEIWQYNIGIDTNIAPVRGWLRGGLIIPQKSIDTNIKHDSNDNYSLKWELSVDKWRFPISSLLSYTSLYTNWSAIAYRTDYGNDTSGYIVRWDFNDNGAQEYYMQPTENAWNSTWTTGSNLTKLQVYEFNEPMRTGTTIKTDLITNQSDYSDIIAFTYPSMAWVMIRFHDENTMLVKMPNNDKKILLFYYGSTVRTWANDYWTHPEAYRYNVPSTLAGTYREEYFHVTYGNNGHYKLCVCNAGGDDTITAIIDGDTNKQTTAAAGVNASVTFSLTSGKHKIKISAGGNYSGGGWVIVDAGETRYSDSYNVTTYDTNIVDASKDLGIYGKSVLMVQQSAAQNSPDVVNLWIDGIYNNTMDEIIRVLEGHNRRVRDILPQIAQTGYMIKYKDQYPIFLREGILPIYQINSNDVISIDLHESYEQYISSIDIYGCTKDIHSSVSIDNPVFTKHIVLTIPWISSSDEAQRYAEALLNRYSILREIGTIKLAGIYDIFKIPVKIIIDSPLIYNTPLVVTSVEYDLNNITTTINVDIPLMEFFKWLRQTYERQNTEITYTCPTGCQTTCQTGCQTAIENTTCDSTCQSSCQATCETSCQTSCELGTSCEEACESSCQSTCETSCQDTCETSCQTTCESSCQTACESSCQDTCETSCQDTCETSCQSSTECGSCETTCQTNPEPV